MSELSRRVFYLMMGIPIGQDFTELAPGMMPASEDVIEAEREALGQQWALLHHMGVLDSAIESAEWFADLSGYDHGVDALFPEEMIEHFRSQGLGDEALRMEAHRQVAMTVSAFAMATIHKLLNEGILALGPRSGRGRVS